MHLNTRVQTGSGVGSAECLRARQYKDPYSNKKTKQNRERERELCERCE